MNIDIKLVSNYAGKTIGRNIHNILPVRANWNYLETLSEDWRSVALDDKLSTGVHLQEDGCYHMHSLLEMIAAIVGCVLSLLARKFQ